MCVMCIDYEDKLAPCPRCGGVTEITFGGEVPCVLCTKCETVFTPNMRDVLRDWWNVRNGGEEL